MNQRCVYTSIHMRIPTLNMYILFVNEVSSKSVDGSNLVTKKIIYQLYKLLAD